MNETQLSDSVFMDLFPLIYDHELFLPILCSKSMIQFCQHFLFCYVETISFRIEVTCDFKGYECEERSDILFAVVGFSKQNQLVCMRIIYNAKLCSTHDSFL